ncbi:MAG: biotin synthase BioB [Lachnospiraceae bacterium]|nr:biotin synthase BioB [Lachnospiraceae bacterium]
MKQLAKEIIQGRRLNHEDDLTVLLNADLKELCEGADEIRRELCGSRVDLCSIINGRSGRCSENCKFCAQSAHNHTSCEEYGFLTQESLMEGCAHAEQQGIDRYSIVTAGRTLAGKDLEKAIEAYKAMHKAYPDMVLCASHGLMKCEDMERLKEAGVRMYHTNVETSEHYFPEICTTHTYEDKLAQIRRAREAGLEVCSGGILGMGESWQDRIAMALLLSELEVTSIPLNFLIPIKGTPLGENAPLKPEEILRIVAMFRYINPTAYIRIAAGRGYFEDGGEALFRAGANATLTGDMLTTVGNNTMQDRAMLHNLGFEMKERKGA